jgi:hypothetical protein
MSIRRSPDEMAGTPTDTTYRQIQRMGNPLINEVIIGTGSKDRFSMSDPKDDAQFGNFVLDPVLSRVLNAVYMPSGAPLGPVADLLRLNTGVPPTPASSRSRLGALAGDLGGFPNGRRVSDDVTDISLRAVAGVLAGSPFNGFPQNAIGDGVNNNDVPYQETFPYVAFAQSGRPATAGQPGPNLGSLDCVLNPLNCTQ